MGIVEKIKRLVQEGDLKNALELFSSWAETNNEDLHNTSILLLSRYNNLKRKTTMGLISYEEAERNQNVLIFAILSTLEDIDERKMTNESSAAKASTGSSSLSNSTGATKRGPKKIFIAYAQEDRKWVDKLGRHMKSLERQGLVESWDDSLIQPGTESSASTMKALNEADIYFFMVSVDFLASDAINRNELPAAMARVEQNDHVSLVPIIVRPCDWESAPYSKFHALPSNAKPLSSWDNEDEALLNVVQSLTRLVK